MERVGVNGGSMAEEQILKVEFGTKGTNSGCRSQGRVQLGIGARIEFGEAEGHAALAESERHAAKIKIMQRQAYQRRVSIVATHASSNGGIDVGQHLHGGAVNMAYSIRSRSHLVVSLTGGPDAGACYAIFASSLSGSHAAGRFSAVAWAGRGGGRLMQLLLVPQKQISASKTSLALWTLERFFLGVGALVPL